MKAIPRRRIKVESFLYEISMDQLGNRALTSLIPNFLCSGLLDRYLKTTLRVFPPS
jgi:hypothetical protein